MYVYLGHLGTEGLRFAAGAERVRKPSEWALLTVGLIATVAVTIYITRLARKALRQQAAIEASVKGDIHSMKQDVQSARGLSWRPPSHVLLTALAVGMLVIAVGAQQGRGEQKRSQGSAPPAVENAPEGRTDGPKFDDSALDAMLRKYVDADGWVDYKGLKRDEAALDGYIASLGRTPLADLERDEKLALLINAYNAFTLRLILDHYPVDSIKDIASRKRWKDQRWRIGSLTLSLDEIDHEHIRPKFAEPRIHFALVCAAIGCPKLRNEAYQAARLDEQLEDQARYMHSHDRWFRYEPGAKTVFLTKLYDWYGSDFEQAAGSVLQFAARYSMPLREARDKGAKPRIEWLDYDWKLNDAKNRR
jgi:hypothetical protein